MILIWIVLILFLIYIMIASYLFVLHKLKPSKGNFANRKFVSDLQQVYGFLLVFRFPSQIELSVMI
jgi:hypothetical protein